MYQKADSLQKEKKTDKEWGFYYLHKSSYLNSTSSKFFQKISGLDWIMIPKWLINTCLYFFARLSYGIIIAEIGINYIASFNTFVWLYCLFVPSNCLDSQRDNSPLASKAFFLKCI